MPTLLVRLLVFASILLAAGRSAIAAPEYTPLSRFGYAPNEALSGLVQGPDGFLWGVSGSGGANSAGTVYKVKPDGSELQIVYSFNALIVYGSYANVGGELPVGSLTDDGAGSMWGMASSGGKYAMGTLFKVRVSDGGFFTIADFGGPGDEGQGKYPEGRLAPDGHGYLWGTTAVNLFKVAIATGKLTSLALFNQTDPKNTGTDPLPGLLLVGKEFWGVTVTGGAGGFGTIFKADATTGAVTTVIELTGTTGANIGASPNDALVNDGTGILWGTTYGGGASNLGTVFKFDPAAGAFTNVVQFTGVSSPALGSNPHDSLVMDGVGNFWGTTALGGANNLGTVFKVDIASGQLTNEYQFAGTDGSSPYGALTNVGNNTLVDVTSAGNEDGCGEMFQVNTTTGALTVLIPFLGLAINPAGALSPDGSGYLWGVTSDDTASDFGVVYKIDPATGTRTTVAALGADQAQPTGKLLFDGVSTFWGVASGGNSIFTVDTATGAVATVLTFTGSSGAYLGSGPVGGLIENGSLYWGVTTGGGVNSLGTVFSIDPVSKMFTTVAQFDGTNGSGPQGLLASDGQGNLWGSTAAGGNGTGTVFNVNTTTGNLTTVANFDGLGGATRTLGSYPLSSLTNDGAGSMWGSCNVSATSGVPGSGLPAGPGLYKIDIATGAFTTVLMFTNTSGLYRGWLPGELMNDGAGNLWGATDEGGNDNFGTIFKINVATNRFTTMVSFGGPEAPVGYDPVGPLLLYSDGNFYGVTRGLGKEGDVGTIFQITLNGTGPAAPVTNTYAAESIAPNNATLEGDANPFGLSTVAYFEYGPTSKYGFQTPPQNIGGGVDTVELAPVASDLLAHTTYHYRTVAVNRLGSVYGEDVTFLSGDHPPVAQNIIYLTTGLSPLVLIPFAGYVSDVDHDKIVGTSVGGGTYSPLNGFYPRSSDPLGVGYFANPGYTGQDSFTYTINDGFGGTATAMIYLLNKQFDGLVLDSDSQIVGRLTVMLTAKAGFSAALNLNGTAFSLAGAFNSQSQFSGSIRPKAPGSLISVTLSLDLTTAEITAAINNGSSLTATLLNADTQIPSIYGRFPLPKPDHYTALIPPPTGAALPQGTGYGFMTVTDSGAVAVAGKLGDGRAFSVGAPLREDGNWVFYFPLSYPGTSPGLIAGTIAYTVNASTGALTWSKPQTNGPFLPAAFTTQVNFQAGLYTAPAAHHQALTFTNPSAATAKVTLSGGGITPIQHNLSVSVDNVVTVTDAGPDRLELKIEAATGALSGSFVNPAAPKQSFSLSGVLYQQTPQSGDALFLGTMQSGSLSLSPQ